MSSSFGNREDAAAAHVLAIPYPIQGHINPMLRFTTRLAEKGIRVSFICYEDSIPDFRSSSGATDASSALQTSGFRFVTVQRPTVEAPAIVNELRSPFEPIMEKFTRDKNTGIAGGPTCIISDMFLPWTCDVAETLQIPRHTLVPSGVIFARYMQGSLVYFDRGQFQISKMDGKLVEFDWPLCIPGLPPLEFHELDFIHRDFTSSFRQAVESMMKSAGVLVNSFLELEEKVVEAFRNPENPEGEGDYRPIKVPKIYPVGPLFTKTAITHVNNVYALEDSSSRCLNWLDSQPSSSVLYIAFGSAVRLRPEQIQELAYGLEASKQRFLWVCPLKKIGSTEESPISITEALPPDFEARVRDRGCIVTGWAPQLQILAHSSTGGFFTHCGWNSSLESIIFGVPMIGWPQGAEQHLNCKYMVGELKVAAQIQTGKKKEIVKRDEVERAVRLLMEDSQGATIRRRAEELQRTATAAMAEGGSQSKIFREFLDDIRSPQVCLSSEMKKLDIGSPH
ncbi:unnamed protein product [Calypogeia fissa]